MAPTAPKKRTTMRAKLAKAQTPSSSTSAARAPPKSSSSGALFPDTKRDRRLVKKSTFLGQIRSKSGASGGVTKRRRPSKKLVADLDSLAAALPELDDDAAGPQQRQQQQPGKVRIKSIRHRPGALKRKEKLVRAETQNIGRSLAFLSGLDGKAADGAGAGGGGVAAPAASAPTANRWAALRAHISGTMEQNPAFLPKEQ
ncbi:hypothetical protein GGTG_09192 [Gaeumannomyces tritici R3-111a-1]|uniref:Ribosome biogenesis protein SLX9 n=1 Tax=Gaeumannomyces tritici (strain R3-111a-1) TaxID=644352 RepID=J3P6Q0_GAET3|nr:hypothetical protein GGTG_09192 [Gaeumannomyces tritici R3-111a-1]EJT72326.1 hypothetical protein GGTG_09192 [Gaeumannomyces tritici R3-111a-1]